MASTAACGVVTAAAAVSGDVACALAFDLGMERGKVDGVRAVLIDWALDHPGITSEQFSLAMERVGLGPLDGSLQLFTDDELRAECERRGIGPMSAATYAAWSGSAHRYVSPSEWRRLNEQAIEPITGAAAARRHAEEVMRQQPGASPERPFLVPSGAVDMSSLPPGARYISVTTTWSHHCTTIAPLPVSLPMTQEECSRCSARRPEAGVIADPPPGDPLRMMRLAYRAVTGSVGCPRCGSGNFTDSSQSIDCDNCGHSW